MPPRVIPGLLEVEKEMTPPAPPVTVVPPPPPEVSTPSTSIVPPAVVVVIVTAPPAPAVPPLLAIAEVSISPSRLTVPVPVVSIVTAPDTVPAPAVVVRVPALLLEILPPPESVSINPPVVLSAPLMAIAPPPIELSTIFPVVAVNALTTMFATWAVTAVSPVVREMVPAARTSRATPCVLPVRSMPVATSDSVESFLVLSVSPPPCIHSTPVPSELTSWVKSPETLMPSRACKIIAEVAPTSSSFSSEIVNATTPVWVPSSTNRICVSFVVASSLSSAAAPSPPAISMVSGSSRSVPTSPRTADRSTSPRKIRASAPETSENPPFPPLIPPRAVIVPANRVVPSAQTMT